MPPTVTIAIPMYNALATIEDTLASVRAQTFQDWRCVVVNDGSTDAGPALVERAAREDDRFEMIGQRNMGLPEARNAGLERALGSEFVMLLDADDVLVPRAIEWLLPGAKELGASYGGFEFLDSTGRSIGRQSPMSATEVGLDEQLEWYRTMLQVSLHSREAIGDIRFDPEVRLAEDWSWCARMALRGVRWRGVEKIVAGYRLRAGGMSKDFSRMNRFHQVAIRKFFEMAGASDWRGRIDLGKTRRERVAGNSAFGYASMQALVDAGSGRGTSRACEIYKASPHPARLTVAQIVQAGANALPFGLCIAPDLDGSRERAWLPALRGWWEDCAAEGWIERGDIERGLVELSRKIVHLDQIAGGMIDATVEDAPARKASRIGVLGLDRNGRRLARLALERGVQVWAFDDWTGQADVNHLDAADGLRVVREAESLHRSAAVEGVPERWVTGLSGDEAARAADRFLALLAPRIISIEFWNDHRERLGERNLLVMRPAWDARPMPATACR